MFVVRAIALRILILRTAQFAFFSMLVVLTILALIDSDIVRPALRWDKAEHFLAYLFLALIGTIAVPRVPLVVILLALFAQSTVLEAIQPYFGRTRDVGDLIANAAGIATFAFCYLARSLRKWLIKPQEGDLIIPAELVSHSLMNKR